MKTNSLEECIVKRLVRTLFSIALLGGLGLACLFVLKNRSTVHAMLDNGFLYVWSLDLNKERQKEDE